MLTVSKRNISVTIVGIGIFEKTKSISYYILKCVCHFLHVEVRGHLTGINSLHPVGVGYGLSSGCQTWWQAALPTEPSHWP